MAKQGQITNQGLDGLTVAARDAANDGRAAKGLPPVHLWNPPFCGDLDMRIAGDGTWFYMGTPIGRPALVRLFSTILKRENGKHFLVTPVEKVGIRVDDAPFLAVEMVREGDGQSQMLRFRTNVDDWVACDAAHRLRFEAAAEREDLDFAGDGRDGEARAGGGEGSDDQRLAAEAVGEHAPGGQEQQSDDVHARADESDRDGNVLGRDADLREVKRGEGGELAVRDDLDERCEREEGEHASPAGGFGHCARD